MMKRLLAILAVLLMAGCSSAVAATTFHRPPHHTPTPRPTHSSTPSPTPTTPTPTPTPTSPTPTTPSPSSSATGPAVPAGYTETYSHNFVTQGETGWAIDNASATVKDWTTPGAEYGLGIGMTAETNQYAEAIMTANENIVTPNTFVVARIYIPAASGGKTANWPAWWTTGADWPADGEIDILEGQSGYSCEQTHYGTLSKEISPASNCAKADGSGTGWLTISMLRTGGEVQVWYNNTYIGQEPLPTTADEELIFQDQDLGNGDSCTSCTGPYVAATTYLSNIQVYSK